MSSGSTKKRKFAAFDIDGTLYRNSLFLDVTEALIQKGVINEHAAKKHFELKQRWHERAHKDSYETFVRKAVDQTMGSLSTVAVKDVEAVAKNITKNNKSFVYTYTRDMLKSLKEQGYFLIAISGSLEEVVREFISYYPFDTYDCTIWHKTTDGKYFTGGHTNKGVNKHLYLRKLMEEHNLTINDSIAVGDSIGDISMLEIVEKPIAFNPEAKLFEYAKISGWQIVIERKNVVLELQKTNGSYQLAETNR